MACPNDTLSRQLDIPQLGKKLIRSYAMVANTSGVAIGEIPAVSQTVLLLERSTVGTQAAPRSSAWAFESCVERLGKLTFEPIGPGTYVPPDFRHGQTGNYLFADGHIKALHGPNPLFPGYQTDSDGVSLCGFDAPLPR